MKNWLNYHHLYYFWMIAQFGSVSAAASRLRLSQPTLSAQLRQLEESLETKLFSRRGKVLKLTEDGTLVLKYAESIFTLGEELMAVLEGGRPTSQLVLRVGVSVSLPKFIVHKTLLPVLGMNEEVRVECFEGKREGLFSQLGAHELDLVLSDVPFSSEVAIKAYNHSLGSSGISFCGTSKLIRAHKGRGLARFDGAPFILPTRNTMIRKAVDIWFDQNEITPKVVAEFEDSALLKTFGAEGHGFFPVASVTGKEVEKTYSVKKVHELKGVKDNFYLISLERKVTHPAILKLTKGAKEHFYA